ncbi:hypothetical protein BCR33DRAFT_724849 [Rhizoclosmatium globosum]|uniref:Uncharacterized protein n=1 Tax=Rhizoclosmatium globosum TaxID=329046 RepID=A0A1Y2B2N0_9FUNG|nr:hypothetical protein BCR33DRAFT_724849 [Rhizoclosmatium globosum]|eukprot:ORY29081.1 hypothetical protein BCR33DRAFT_724849 [Rhizoclosmatium globosum]
MPVNEDATRGSLKMNCRLTAPFSKQDHSEFEKEAYRVLRTQPAHHAVAGPPGTAPPVLTQQPVPSVSDLLNEHRTELGQYNDVKNLLKIRKVYSQEAHTPCPEAIVERYNAAVASIYENPLHAIGQIEWQNEEGDVQLDIDNPVDISIAQLEHEGFTEELLADHATAIQVRKQDIVAVEKANKVNDVAAQTNARMVKCVLDHVCSEIRGDISHFSLFQESINFLHTKAAGLSDHDQRGIYERHFLALEANVKAGKFSVAAVKEIRKRYLETFGEEAIAGTSEYTTFAHRIVALLTTAIGNERSTSYQIVQNYLVNLAGKEQTLEWPVLVAHLERCENAIAAKKRGADPLESQSLKVNRVGADDQALPHAPECNNTRCSTCAWHGPESKHNTCTCHHLPKCGRWDGKSSRDAHFKYHKDCSANPAATKGKQPARSNNTAATNHANGQQVVLSRRDLNKLIRSVKSQAGCRPNEDQPNNNHDQPGPSSRGGKRGGPRVSALRSRMAQGNSGSSSTSTSGDVEMGEGSTADQPETLDVTDAEVIGLQDGHFVGDSGAMEHIHDAGGHANQVTRLIDANFAMGNRRNSMWYSDTYGPDAQWDEIFRVVKVSQLSMFQDHDLVDYEVLRSNNVVISAIKRTGSGEIKTGLCQIEAMDRDYHQAGVIQPAVFA